MLAILHLALIVGLTVLITWSVIDGTRERRRRRDAAVKLVTKQIMDDTIDVLAVRVAERLHELRANAARRKL